MNHLFISYDHQDRFYARSLADYLLDSGFDIWVDERIDYGENWWREIVQAIRECAAFVVIMTPRAEASKWVQREVALADQQFNKPIFPVLLEGDNWPLFILTQYIDVRGGDLPPTEFCEKLASVAARREEPGVEITPLVERPVSDVSPEIRELLDRLLNWNTPPAERAEVGRRLAEMGDPRPGVLAPDGVPDIEWCEVPAGRFQMGGDSEAHNPWPGKTVDLPYAFWIARYPVTYAQYEAFINAQGYSKREYWTPAGQDWKSTQKQLGLSWRDPVLHIANHPVVGVTWYEAHAFTRWLEGLWAAGQLRVPVQVPSQYEIRLLTEAEWEKAARYPDGRVFPWGNKYVSGYANLDELSTRTGPHCLMRTTAVGLYPQGANPVNRAHDLSGNVGEWLLSVWRDRYRHPEDNSAESENMRGTRGGSWINDQQSARAASRDGSVPSYRSNFLGFRVGISVPLG